ncbi:MAG: hypothetical protein H7255_16820, partial [Ramlibacter sp.]|nr:hypothetical protein [Ramlibacter sp.]
MEQAKPSVAVVGWDMSHNALGRAWVLADMLGHQGWTVQLAGPLCQGREVWQPLRNATPSVDTFLCRGMANVMHKCVRHVEANPHRAVVVSKQRFPSML